MLKYLISDLKAISQVWYSPIFWDLFIVNKKRDGSLERYNHFPNVTLLIIG